jgi:hypothetical protein
MDDGGQSLWLRHVATTSNVPIIPPAVVRYWGLTFSRDGDYVYYARWRKNEIVGVLYQVPVIGGAERKLIVDVDTLSPFPLMASGLPLCVRQSEENWH